MLLLREYAVMVKEVCTSEEQVAAERTGIQKGFVLDYYFIQRNKKARVIFLKKMYSFYKK